MQEENKKGKMKNNIFVQKKIREEKDKKYSKGITLVALVITIIVLIILAGISINLVLGENGLFNRAKKAAEDYKQAAIDEQKMTNDLEEGIDKIANDNRPKTIEEAKDYGYFYEKTTLEDSYKNKIVIPAGFKIAEDSGDNVTDGIVIEDKDIIDGIGENRGNQYVWIPVSDVDESHTNKIKNGEEGIEITLGRYTFGSNGKEQLVQKASEYTNEKLISSCYQELEEFSEGNYVIDLNGKNRTAKDLAGFINSVKANGGYYIARYEASYGTDNKPNSKASTNYNESSAPTQEGTLWNNITQIDAAKACDNMYDTVSSDLVNSYAWDTAIVFIQKYSENENYANEHSKNTENLANTGEREDSTTDKVCNIYDMASNCYEWTTENSSYTKENSYANPCVYRGGNDSSNCTSTRNYSTNSGYNGRTFRPILYINNTVS